MKRADSNPPPSLVPTSGPTRGGKGAPAILRRPLVAGLALSALVLALNVGRLRARARARALPDLGAIPAFSMRDQRGVDRTAASLAGSVEIVDFFFTSCPVMCPKLTAKLASVEATLAERHPDRAALPIRLISISVDPENDSPDKLAAYARRYGANDERWWFLTGDPAALERVVVDGFKMTYAKADPSRGIEQIMHGNWFVLVDREGRIRGYYLSDDDRRVAALVEDAEALAR
jgi:protein SCO1/2